MSDDTPGVGHNDTVGADRLRSFIERVERLEEEKQEIADQIKEVFAEIKGTGYDVTAVRAILKLRKQDPDKLAEQEAVLDLYKEALDMPVMPRPTR
ncbi:MAG: putative double-stranded DNA-binding protein [Prokaryotic dsDNA virus sp.]|nr:MAG: putative double-stranded DNA-binding protein [Prokaryotic dsDNA virus sp.]|tara:strand:+ start:3776 stop:4063 length:288 start_codon:yes stop_codon:yes gene_type:complete